MYKITIVIDELYLRLDWSSIHLIVFAQIQFQHNGSQWVKLNPKVQLSSPMNLQKINVSHVMYARKQEVQRIILKYRLKLICCQGKNGNTKHLKNAGHCTLQFQDLKIFIENYKNLQLLQIPPTIVSLIGSPDKRSHLKLSIKIEQRQDFKNVHHHSYPTTIPSNQQEIDDKDILLQEQRQKLLQTKKQCARLSNRNTKLSSQIQHLIQQNKQLGRQINQKYHSIKIDQQLKQDKLDLLIQRKLNAEQTYKKAKQSIGKVFNLINEYGNPNLIEEMTNLLIRNTITQS